MKQLVLVMFVIIALAGCKDRVIWDDKGKMEEATTDREVWDSGGKMGSGDRKIWNDQNDEAVVK